uniref:Uncharacterized protein n=1 Tax=Odontella aurita TaxID=265563 RepID=A0A6U6GXF8_9STRA|mmetsp:Transcript_42098/g.127701  ORF Transcript_42098/g.127701 Transcript_42098/m.127701 type:complete len:851 (+) Transcript_42098:104-2656(+)
MACLDPPLTVIGGGSGDQDADLDADADHLFSPPAATWYDECHQHFVALLQKQKKRRSGDSISLSLSPTIGSAGSYDAPRGEVAYYQTLSMPPQQHVEVGQNTLEGGESGAFEEVLNKFKGERRSLVRSTPLSVLLPHELAVQTPDDDNSASSSSPTLRVPILAKFSLDSQLLALQFTDTMVRIARVAEGEEMGGTADEGTTQLKQWTIDLSIDSTPVSTAAGSMPPPRRQNRIGNFLPIRAGSFGGSSSKDDGVTGKTKILPGGVLWSNHGGNSEDLILVTTSSVLFYKISLNRNHMAKSRAYPHPFVAGFWFEPKARALLVGSYIVQKDVKMEKAVELRKQSSIDCTKRDANEPPTVMVMRTYFLNRPPKPERSDSSASSLTYQSSPSTSFSGENRGTSSDYSLPRFELPPPARLQPFIVGGQRSVAKDASDSASVEPNGNSDQSSRGHVVSLDDIHLVNVYGEVYCVELGCLGGDGVGINLFQLDQKGGRVLVDQIVPPFQMPRSQPGSNFVSVSDNLICIHSQSSTSTLFLDVKPTPDIIRSDEKTSVIISEHRPGPESIFDDRFSFLSPCFLLNPQGRGNLHQMRLNLPVLLKAMPPSKAALPLLLRRESTPALAHTIALRHLNDIVINDFYNDTEEESTELKMWIDSIASCYALNERVATAWDLEACHPLIFKAALLKANSSSESNEVMHNADLFSICSRIPQRCASILTQSELLEGLLIPRATVAISAKDMHMLRYMLDLAILLFGSFEEREILPCPAFECLIVALSWRLGDFVEVNSMLSSKQVRRTAQNRKLEQISTIEIDGEQTVTRVQEEAFNSGLDLFAEMLLMLSKEDVKLPSYSAGE